MIIPVRCFTCNKTLANIYEYYIEEVDKGKEPKEVLEKLEIKRYCCKRHLISTIDMMKII